MTRTLQLLALLWLSALLGSAAWSDELLPYTSSTRMVLPLQQWQMSIDGGRSWQRVSLPTVAPSQTDAVRYRKELYLDSTATERSWQLYCDGVRDGLEVTINGQYLGRYYSARTPLQITLPAHLLRQGRNVLELTATAASDEALLQRRFQWRAPVRPIGVTGSVALVGASAVFIERVAMGTEVRGGDGVVRCSVWVASSARAATAEVTLSAELLWQGMVVASVQQPVMPTPQRSVLSQLQVSLPNPQLWSVGQPNLYQLRLQLRSGGAPIDEVVREIGFRRVDVGTAGSGFLQLGGVPLPLRGVVYLDAWHQRDGELIAPDYQRDVELLRLLGVNAVYVAWDAPSPRFVRLCDRAGILVLVELPFSDIPARYFEGEELRTRARNTLLRYSDAYGADPAVVGVVAGGLLNFHHRAVQQYLEEMAVMIHQQQWLCTVVVPVGHALPAALPVDGVIVTDQLQQRRTPRWRELLQRTLATVNKPWALLGGAVLQPFNRNGYADPLSLEAQAEHIATLYRRSSEAKADGVVVWCFADYPVEYPLLTTNLPAERLCHAGLVDTARQRRLAFEMVRALNTNEPEPLLQAGSYDEGTPYVFLATGLLGIFLLLWLINRSPRFRDYLARALLRPHSFFTDIRDQRILLQGQTLMLAVVIAATYALTLATLLFHTRTSPAADYLSTHLALTPGGKALYIQLAWSPQLALTVVVLLVLVQVVAAALIIRGVAALLHRTVMFADAVTMVVWSFVPVVLLLPIAMVLFRLLPLIAAAVWFAVVGVLTVWGVVRLFRALSIALEVPESAVWAVGGGGIVVLMLIVFIVLQSQVALGTYLGHYATVASP